MSFYKASTPFTPKNQLQFNLLTPTTESTPKSEQQQQQLDAIRPSALLSTLQLASPPSSQSRKRSYSNVTSCKPDLSYHQIQQQRMQKQMQLGANFVYYSSPSSTQQALFSSSSRGKSSDVIFYSSQQPAPSSTAAAPSTPSTALSARDALSPNPNTKSVPSNPPWNASISTTEKIAPASNPTTPDNNSVSEEAVSHIKDTEAYVGYLSRQKKECNVADAASIWSPDVEQAFMEALRRIPHVGRRKITVHGRPCGRNELISEYIQRKTGKVRTRKQVSSHIQVLKHLLRDDQEFMELVVETPPERQAKIAIVSPIFSKNSAGKQEQDERHNNQPRTDIFMFSEHTSTDEATPCPRKKIRIDTGNDTSLSVDNEQSSFMPMNFSMHEYNGQIYSQLIRPQLESPIKSKQATKIVERFPLVSKGINDLYLSSVDIISGKVKFNLNCQKKNESTFKSELDFMASPDVHRLKDGGATKARIHQWDCVTKVYTLGNEVLSLVEPVRSQEGLGQRTETLSLPFANDFWSAFISGITMEGQSKSDEAAARAVSAITMVQEIHCLGYEYNSEDDPVSRKLGLNTLHAVLVWEFEMVLDAFSARTVFRKVLRSQSDSMNTTQAPSRLTSVESRSFSAGNCTPQTVTYYNMGSLEQGHRTPMSATVSTHFATDNNNYLIADSFDLARPFTAFCESAVMAAPPLFTGSSNPHHNSSTPLFSDSNMWYPVQSIDLLNQRVPEGVSSDGQGALGGSLSVMNGTGDERAGSVMESINLMNDGNGMMVLCSDPMVGSDHSGAAWPSTESTTSTISTTTLDTELSFSNNSRATTPSKISVGDGHLFGTIHEEEYTLH